MRLNTPVGGTPLFLPRGSGVVAPTLSRQQRAAAIFVGRKQHRPVNEEFMNIRQPVQNSMMPGKWVKDIMQDVPFHLQYARSGFRDGSGVEN